MNENGMYLHKTRLSTSYSVKSRELFADYLGVRVCSRALVMHLAAFSVISNRHRARRMEIRCELRSIYLITVRFILLFSLFRLLFANQWRWTLWSLSTYFVLKLIKQSQVCAALILILQAKRKFPIERLNTLLCIVRFLRAFYPLRIASDASSEANGKTSENSKNNLRSRLRLIADLI